VPCGRDSAVVGGYYNTTNGNDDAILGGCNNYTGSSSSGGPNASQCATETQNNNLMGDTITGGLNNVAWGTDPTVGGGNGNKAEGNYGAWAAGGYENVSNGNSTSILGGVSHTLTTNNGTQVSQQTFNP
jgi:hypothetical protein